MEKIEIKTFKTRSSATDVLREIGVPSRDYNLFINQTDNAMFECRIDLAKLHAATLKLQTSETTPAAAVRQSIDNAVTRIVKTLSDVSTDAAAAAIVETAELAADQAKKIVSPFPTTESVAEKLRAAARGEALVRATGQNGSTVNIPATIAKNAGLKIHKEPAQPTVKTTNKAAKTKKAQKDAKAVKGTKTQKEAKVTVSSRAREMIIAGKTNDEVWAMMKKEFRLDDSKKSYPAWYRRECVKKGLIKA